MVSSTALSVMPSYSLIARRPDCVDAYRAGLGLTVLTPGTFPREGRAIGVSLLIAADTRQHAGRHSANSGRHPRNSGCFDDQLDRGLRLLVAGPSSTVPSAANRVPCSGQSQTSRDR